MFIRYILLYKRISVNAKEDLPPITNQRPPLCYENLLTLTSTVIFVGQVDAWGVVVCFRCGLVIGNVLQVEMCKELFRGSHFFFGDLFDGSAWPRLRE